MPAELDFQCLSEICEYQIISIDVIGMAHKEQPSLMQ